MTRQFHVHESPDHDDEFGVAGKIIGPCPGCESWSVEYDFDTVCASWSQAEFETVLEGLLEEHMLECSGLREIWEASLR